MERLTIIKVGGKVVEHKKSLQELLFNFSRYSGNKIMVHEGGRLVTSIAKRLDIKTKKVAGHRIIDDQVLDVVTMVYGGLVNKRIVAGLQGLNCNAIGMTGADMDIIRAVKRPVEKTDYGFSGDIIDVSTRELESIIDQGVVPIVAPLTHDGKGQLLNADADAIAAELGIALNHKYRVQLVYCIEKKGVLADLKDDDSVIHELSFQDFLEHKEEGAINEEMALKLYSGFSAMRNGVEDVLITSASELGGNIGKGTRLLL